MILRNTMNKLFTLLFLLACSAMKGQVINALDFDGMDDQVVVPHDPSLDITGDITIEAWIKPDVLAPEKTIVIKGTVLQCNTYGLFLKDGHLAYVSGGDCGWLGRGPNSPVQAGEWQHVAAAGSGSDLRLYINGQLTDKITLASTIGPLTSQDLLIGNSFGSQSNFIDATIDEVRIWNVARAQAQIQADMNRELTGDEPGLVAYYDFNQGTAGADNQGVLVVSDRTANTNYGQLNNFALDGDQSNWVASQAPGLFQVGDDVFGDPLESYGRPIALSANGDVLAIGSNQIGGDRSRICI